ncbi:MAG: tRNA (adenosine(37)-N6)-threonylcarbamoyltransferase complex dimerization subunit type 1 TsaB [Acidobacteria bacterium]|jgi:tRNA threonylcarbamoyl adenosine modification protein YeaZ|nr:MAG: tRNA (adenosine(37)-N6)-threonylcarbamoyltransferase complex dimerization subunit type 1 TsaB [Acidobacteriota bacterium]GIU81131.1 MAG: tRNA (adenosine(37)-N6)-threonylcarbamoyltransferase complex dimerization subunit type 1 TsaB [Pyrinomonadaceae bacterium]
MDNERKFMLCFDTASRVLSISLFSSISGREIVGYVGKDTISESLLSKITRLLQKQGATLREIESIVISLGPGSFTGIRAGVAVAKGIKFGSRYVKLLGASNLMALAMASSEVFVGKVLCVIDAGRGSFFTQEFLIKEKYVVEELCEPQISSSDVISRHALIVSSDTGFVFGIDGKFVEQVLSVSNLAKYLGVIALRGNASEVIEPLYVSGVVYRRIHGSFDGAK